MKTNLVFAFVMIAVMTGAALGAAVSQSLTASANNVLLTQNRTCGSCNRLALSSSPSVSSVLKFDLSVLPADADITSATLGLFIASTGSGTPQVEVYSAEAAWTQSIVTATDPLQGDLAFQGDPTYDYRSFADIEWTNDGGISGSVIFQTQIQVGNNVVGGGDLNTLSNANFLTLVRGWKSSPSTNFGVSVIVRSGSSGTIFLGARNHADTTIRPTLSLVYNTESGTAPTTVIPQSFTNPIGGVGLRVPSRYTSSSTSGAVIGGVIGGIAALMIIVAVATIILRR